MRRKHLAFLLLCIAVLLTSCYAISYVDRWYQRATHLAQIIINIGRIEQQWDRVVSNIEHDLARQSRQLEDISKYLLIAGSGPTVHGRTRDCDRCPEMIVLGKGAFLRGVPNSERIERKGSRNIMGSVAYIPYLFAVASKPVTVGEFRSFTEETGSSWLSRLER